MYTYRRVFIARFSGVAMRTSCVHDVHTVDAERIDITVDSIKRYYSNVPRNATYATYWDTSAARHKSSCVLRFGLLVSFFVIGHSLSILFAHMRGLFCEITETEDIPPLARKCAGNGWEIIPHFLAAKSAFETSMPYLDYAFHVQSAVNVRLFPFLLSLSWKIDTRDANDDSLMRYILYHNFW